MTPKYEEHKFKDLSSDRVTKVLLDLCYMIEESWDNSEVRDKGITTLKTYLNWLTESQSNPNLETLQRLLSKDYTIDSIQKLYNFTVPLERQLNHAVKDDHFITTQDKQAGTPTTKAPITVVLDHLRSAFNVGSIIRSSEAFSIEKLIFVGYTPTPEDQQVQRTSMGTSERVDWEKSNDLQMCIEHLKTTGHKIYAVETAAKANALDQFNIEFPCAFIFGNERFGLSPATLKMCDAVLEIGLAGTKNSLNVSNALSIVLYQATKDHRSNNA